MSKNDRIIPEKLEISPEYLDDHLTLIAKNIEDALLRVNAVPQEDYTYKDLMGWAVQLSKDKIDELKLEWQS